MKHQKFEESKVYVEELGTFMVPLQIAEEVLEETFQEYGSQIENALGLIQSSLNLGEVVEKIEKEL